MPWRPPRRRPSGALVARPWIEPIPTRSSRVVVTFVTWTERWPLILVLVMLFVIVFGPLFGADSRRSWRNVNQKPRERTVGSMRPEDWPPTEFKR